MASSSSAGSQSQPVPIGSLKHDPAWKHCQMFKNGDRVQLKCLYCLKIFSGGGIHRIKEHLACQKGNASCCPKVPPEVTRDMLQSLEVVVTKKKKKQQMTDGIRGTMPDTNEIDMGTFSSPSGGNTALKLVVTPSSVNQTDIRGFMRSDEGMNDKSLDRRKRGRVENSSPVVTPDNSPHLGDFGRKMAIRAAHTLLPAEWWSTYGGGCPNLARLAIRILNQTCSASFCKLSSIPFEQVHSTKNHLERQRLSDLVFVQYNLRLQQINLGKYKDPGVMDPISTDYIGLTEDWVTEKIEFFGSGDSDWVALHQPVNNSMLLESPSDEPEDLIAGFDYQERPNRLQDDEEVDVKRH
ncbi:hAT transposon superfamily [Thalictrum thalictroides]|uniref:HAT transposon superfamily n=1 Tax=Thalictrum thalictroides TaxID=46969 RepID=A0A7J6VTU2_THATH|nr:hAT transposon superfamily [Thalictrum thalictroides]